MPMRKTRTIPNKPRFDYARQKARDLLVELNITSFPVDPFKIIEAYKDSILCFSWSQLKAAQGVPDPFHLRQKKTDARILWSPKANKFVLVYDDEQKYPLRLRWTIMHELGHCFLGHLIDFPETEIKQNNDNQYSEKYGILEVEANYFAAEVLCPTAIFQYFIANGKPTINSEYLSRLCLISNEAAKKRFANIFNVKRAVPKDPILLRNFYRFFLDEQSKVLYETLPFFEAAPLRLSPWPSYEKIARKCPSCHSYVASRSYNYCLYCGYKLGRNYSRFSVWDMEGPVVEDERVYKLPPASPHVHLPWIHEENGASHLLFCPHCSSGNLSTHQHCDHCGSPLINYCTSENRRVPSEARFCPYCGKPTTFNSLYAEVEDASEEMNYLCKTTVSYLGWEPYPYWDFMKSRMTDIPLRVALAYSHAYLNDNDNLIVLVRSQSNRNVILEYKDPFFSTLKLYDPTLTDLLVQVAG